MNGSVKPRPRVVILTPVYNEEASLLAYEEAVRDTLLTHPDVDFRVLFIDDGSVFVAPIRDWNYDPRFDDVELHPPYSPIAINIAAAAPIPQPLWRGSGTHCWRSRSRVSSATWAMAASTS